MQSRSSEKTGMTEVGNLKRIANLYPRVQRFGHLENVAFIPKRQFDNTQICFQISSDPNPPDLMINGRKYVVPCPRVLIKRCGEIHEIAAAGVVSSFHVVYAHDTGVENIIPRELSCSSITITPRLQTLFAGAVELCRRTGEFGICDRLDECCFSMLQEMLLSLAERSNPPEKIEQQIGQACSWLQLHFCEPVDWKALALKFGFSGRSFFRHWGKCMNCSPGEHLAMLRFAKAEQLLTDTDLKIADVAVEIGYGSAESFIAAFRKRYGISPLAFRRKHWLK